MVQKSTTVATKKRKLEALDGLRCNHWDNHKGTHVADSATLSRYPPWMQQQLVTRIVESDQQRQTPTRKTDKPRAPLVRPEEVSDRAARLSNWQETMGIQTVMVTSGFKRRPLRDGGGKVSPGRLHPNEREINRLAWKGKDVMEIIQQNLAQIRHSAKREPEKMPVSGTLLQQIRDILAGGQNYGSIVQGQPFYLKLIKLLLQEAGDADADYMDELAKSVPLGVEEPTLVSPGIWPTKTELRGEEWDELEPTIPEATKACKNYPSADENAEEIRKTYGRSSIGDGVGPSGQMEGGLLLRLHTGGTTHRSYGSPN